VKNDYGWLTSRLCNVSPLYYMKSLLKQTCAFLVGVVFSATSVWSAPCIYVSQINVSFTGQCYSVISPQTISVTNTGDATLNYSISNDVFWLSVSNVSGSLSASQGTNVTVSVSTRGLDPRTYTGHLIITDPIATNSPQIINVTLTIKTLVLPSMVVAWGDNSAGQTNCPTSLTNAIAISGGEWHSLALRADGTVCAWGTNNLAGQLDIPPDLSNVIAIAAGGFHSLAQISH
jgi:hypothetical protein